MMDFIGYFIGKPNKISTIGFFGLSDFVGYSIGIPVSKVGFVGLLDFTGCSVRQKISSPASPNVIIATDGE